MKSNTRHVTVLMLDGTKFEATGTYMALADRVAFERKWKVQFEGLFQQEIREVLDPDAPEGTRKVSTVQVGPEWYDERGAFFAWRLLHRQGVDVGEFDAWVEGVDDLTIEAVDGPPDEPGVTGLDPTAPEAPPGN